MKKILSAWSLSTVLIVFAVLAFACVAYPSKTHAAEISAQTAQLLPLSPVNECPALGVTGLTPYIYNGALHSFEFTVSDSSYVSIAGSLGGKDVPFFQMVRRIESSGELRVHVDVATTPVGSGIPFKVTMLSARGGNNPVCISIVSGIITPEGVTVSAPVAPTPISAPGKAPSAMQPKPTPAPASPAGTSSVEAGPTTTAGSQNILKDICGSGGAPRLWFALLVAYALIVAGAVFGRSNLPVTLRSQEWIAAMIVVPFLLLFGIWYFVESCRVSAWVPIIATLIALAGLAAAFWEKNTDAGTPVINLPAAGPKK